jgi:hypothetical protein
MKEFETIKRQTADGKKEEKQIFEIAEEEVGNFVRMGVGSGPTFGFCVYMGLKHCEDFFDRVRGYRIVSGGLAAMIDEAQAKAGLVKPKTINVEFYENPPALAKHDNG